jgi:hypothetical protein
MTATTKRLTPLSEPRQIDLKEEASKLGVDIVTDAGSLNPASEAVFFPIRPGGSAMTVRFVSLKNPAVPV